MCFPNRTLFMKETTMLSIQTSWSSGRCLTDWQQRRRKSSFVSINTWFWDYHFSSLTLQWSSSISFRLNEELRERLLSLVFSKVFFNDSKSITLSPPCLCVQCSSQAATAYPSRVWRASGWQSPSCPTPLTSTCLNLSPVTCCCCCPCTRDIRWRGRCRPDSFRLLITTGASGKTTPQTEVRKTSVEMLQLGLGSFVSIICQI